MRICIAQIKSLKGKVQKNIETHLEFIEDAVALDADLIVFPELSITNFEPDLARELAVDVGDKIFDVFQKKADKNEITIGVGMPTKTIDGINISMIIFPPNKERIAYSKQMLHEDELPHFVCGKAQVFLNLKGKKIAVGICYETLQREHFLNTKQKGAAIYIASVAKPMAGIEKANKHFQEISNEFSTPILMSNCIGPCDNFLSTGQSAVWNENGEIIAQLDDKNEGLIIYDTETNHTEIDQLKILKGQLSDLKELFQIYINAKTELEKNNIYQWTNNYPTISIVENDLKKGVLYTLQKNNEIIGAINLSEQHEPQYQLINWKFNTAKALVIHRLVINPRHQRKGYAKKLMNFAENFAKENNYSSIRLDVYSQNKRVLNFYRKRNYINRGEVNFPERNFPFYCMEKRIR